MPAQLKAIGVQNPGLISIDGFTLQFVDGIAETPESVAAYLLACYPRRFSRVESKAPARSVKAAEEAPKVDPKDSKEK